MEDGKLSHTQNSNLKTRYPNIPISQYPKNMADDKEIIFSMVNVSKTFPPHKQVLKDIYLSFFTGRRSGSSV